jgi:hypothetical protein
MKDGQDGTGLAEFARGGGSMRRTVYNRSGVEVGAIVDGCMYAVPAGMPGGGPGTLVCSERIARVLVEREPERLSLSAGCYSPQDVSRMRELKLEALRQFCEELMRGEARPVRELELEFATAQADTRPVETRGSAAGGKAA